MHILNVDTLLDPVTGGGTTERTFQMSRHLVKAGAKCTLLTTDLGLTPERVDALAGVEVVVLPCFNKRFFIPKFSFRTIDDLVKKADIVHLMNHWTPLNAFVYRSIVKQKKPYVICPAGSLPIFGRSGLLKKIYNLVVGKNIVRNCNRFIAVTESEIPQYLTYGGSTKKVAVIPNAIAEDEFIAKNNTGFRKKFNLPDNPFILFLGRLNPIKGPDLLLNAFLKLKKEAGNFHLVFAGPDSGLQTELVKIVNQNNARDRVDFIGYLGAEDKSLAYHAADLLVIPSRQEAMSIVAIEAGICGTPVLLTDQCGFDQISETGGGKVVPASEEGLANGLRCLLKQSSELAEMGKKLKEFVRSVYLWEANTLRFLALYEQILRTG